MSLFCFRLFPAPLDLLPGLDLPGRALLHGLDNAPVHHQRGPLPVAALPHEVRQEQVASPGHLKNRLRVAAVDRDESAIKPHVFQSKSDKSVKSRLSPLSDTRRSIARSVTLLKQFLMCLNWSIIRILFQDQDSLIIDGTCQIPDPLYKFIGSIICFYIPLLVMLVTYALTVRLLDSQKQNLGAPDWSSNWMGGPTSTPLGKPHQPLKLISSNQTTLQ